MPASRHDLRSHEQPALAVDLVLLTIVDGQVRVLMQRRQDAGRVGGEWALPGGIVRIDETLEQCASRVLHDKVGLKDAYIEQLQTFSEIDRDPRGRIVSVAYYALTPEEHFVQAHRGKHDLCPAIIQYLGNDAKGAAAQLRDDRDVLLGTAFDHARIIARAIERLRGKLDYTAVGFELLPRRFTLRDLQEIHEAILGTKLTKPAFRRKMLARGLVRPTGKRERGMTFRPAELYERSDTGDVQ